MCAISNKSILSYLILRITALLHGENIVDSAVWPFLYVYMPLTSFIVSSMSTVSFGSPEHIDPKVKLQTGLISLAIFSVKYNFCFKLVYTSSAS